jgi:ribonuclease I
MIGARLLLIALAFPVWFWLGLVCPARAAPPSAFCGPDRCMSGLVPLPPLKVQARDGTGTPGDFDYYVLSLSWSSGFCETPAGERARGQCDAGANLGFVVHGLWPQYEHGYPSDCGPAARFPSRMALDSAQGLYPSEGLARHEWQKHGTCSGKSPTDYFADVRRARVHRHSNALCRPQRRTDLDAGRYCARLHRRKSAAAARHARRCLRKQRPARGQNLFLQGSA